MLHFSRSGSIIGAPLILVTLLACVTPAGAMLSANGLALNGLALNGVALNGSALSDLNGVAVEAVVIPEAAIR
jgi:hypothetical protein